MIGFSSQAIAVAGYSELIIAQLSLVYPCHELQVPAPLGLHLSDLCLARALEVAIHVPKSKGCAWRGSDDEGWIELILQLSSFASIGTFGDIPVFPIWFQCANVERSQALDEDHSPRS